MQKYKYVYYLAVITVSHEFSFCETPTVSCCQLFCFNVSLKYCRIVLFMIPEKIFLHVEMARTDAVNAKIERLSKTCNRYQSGLRLIRNFFCFTSAAIAG